MNTPTPKPLLILDMDECLLHATSIPIENVKESFRYLDMYVYARPRLTTFLKEIDQHFTLAIWSTGTDRYVQELIKNITPHDINYAFVWGRSKCRKTKDDFFGFTHYYKPLDKLKRYGYRPQDIIMIDDTPSKIITNYATVITIESFEGNPTDNVLEVLLDKLISVE